MSNSPEWTRERLQAAIDLSPFNAFLGLRVEAIDFEAPALRVSMPLRDELRRAVGGDQFHGGPLAALIDVAGDFVVALRVGDGVPTVQLMVDYLRPAPGPRVTAHARARRIGRSLAFVEVEVRDAGERVCASGRGLYVTQAG